MHNRLIIPILNQPVKIGKDKNCFLARDLSIRVINKDEYYAISTDEAKLKYGFGDKSSDSLWLIFENISEEVEGRLEYYLTVIAFLFNCLGDGVPLGLGEGLLLKINRNDYITIEKILTMPVFDNFLHKRKYSMSSSKLHTFNPLFQTFTRLFDVKDIFYFTLKKYNSHFLRTHTHDKIVDAATCMESIIPFPNEISFRFSLYHSLLYGNSVSERKEAFQILKKFYDSRSGIVHGSIDDKGRKKSLDEVEQKWGLIADIMKNSIITFIFFIADNIENGVQDINTMWKEYLEGLSFGEKNQFVRA